MVGRPGKFQPRFTAGELDPLIQQNTDLHIYQTGASRFENVAPLPQGGFRNRWGTQKIARVRTVLAWVDMSSCTFTAPSGGNAQGPTQGAALVTNTLGGGWSVVWTMHFGTPQAINAIDLAYFLLGSATGTLMLQYSSDNANWTTLATQAIDVAPHYRRLALEPGQSVSVAYWRLVVAPVAASTFTLGAVSVLKETGQLGPVRVKPFTYSITEAYDVVLTVGNADIYDASGRVGTVVTPYDGRLTEVDVIQSLDTMLCFHDAFTPWRIMRQGSPYEWNWDSPPFTNIPNVDFGAVYTNGVAAAWDLSFFGFDAGSTAYPMPAGGAHFSITIGTNTTQIIQYPNPVNPAQLIANMTQAISQLANVDPGFTVTQPAAATTPDVYRITFSGAGNTGDAWFVSGKGVDKGDTAITSTHAVIGTIGGEPIMSATRGWPACGVFYSGRLLMGGFSQKANYVSASVARDYFNMDTALQGSEAAMLLPLDTQGAEQVINLHIGRNLIIFTDEAEYYLYDHVLDATTLPTLILASRNGLARGVEPIENEAKTIYTQRNRGRFFEFGYSYPDQNYISTDISVSSSGLVTGIVDDALRKSTTTTDVNTMFAVRDDGAALGITLLRGQDITAYARLTSDGSWLAVDVNGRFETNFIAQRLVDGVPVQFLERVEDGSFLDCAETHTLNPPGTSVSNLFDLEDATVWAVADGFVMGPYVVSLGNITLDRTATNVTVGRWTPPDARTLPQPRDVAPRTVVRRPARVHTVRLTVEGTTSIAIGANDQPAADVPIISFGQLTDVPASQQPYSGPLASEGILGFSTDAIVQITQMRPGALIVTGVTVEVDL